MKYDECTLHAIHPLNTEYNIQYIVNVGHSHSQTYIIYTWWHLNVWIRTWINKVLKLFKYPNWFVRVRMCIVRHPMGMDVRAYFIYVHRASAVDVAIRFVCNPFMFSVQNAEIWNLQIFTRNAVHTEPLIAHTDDRRIHSTYSYSRRFSIVTNILKPICINSQFNHYDLFDKCYFMLSAVVLSMYI